MQFSIITPSFRNSNWLKLCIPSVADQGVELEHIVQDSCSDDGTQEWLPHDQRVKACIEKDTGMYDAVNRGLKKASGDILAYINCDEQYLPGALLMVKDYFQKNPGVEMVFADALVVNADGSFRCYRKVQKPHKYYTMVSGNLCVLTCSIFFRRSLIEKRQHFFNTRYRDLGDVDWVIRALDASIPMGVLRHYTTIFTETGVNMNLLPNAQREKAEFCALAPKWAQASRPLLVGHHRLRRLLDGAYVQKPFSYAIYTTQSPNQRVPFKVDKPTARWVR